MDKASNTDQPSNIPFIGWKTMQPLVDFDLKQSWRIGGLFSTSFEPTKVATRR